MGLLDQFSGPLLQEITNLITNQKGGLGGLVKKLSKSGLGDQVASWVGMGENKAVEHKQLGDALGQKTIKDLARKLNLPEEEVSKAVAGALPEVVNQLTPKGKVEEENILGKGISILKGLFK